MKEFIVNKFGKISLFTAGIMYPAAACIGGVVTWYLKTNNPDNVDITAGLAYLRPILVTSFAVFVVFFIISLITGVISIKKEPESFLGKFALVLLSVIIVLSAGAVVLNAKTDDAEKSYRKQQVETVQD
jgi:fumarate reductase subunit C